MPLAACFRRARAGVFLFAFVSAFSAAPAASQTLPVITLQAGLHQIHAEVADTPGTRQTGLMNRRTLAPNSGMLFVFEDADIQCFWMRNTYIPLSIAFLDADGRIVNIADMQPLDDTPHCAEAPVAMALEMSQGWFAERGLAAGGVLRGLPAPAGAAASARR